MSKRLTTEQKAEVITDFAAGKTKSDIARKFNVSPNAISKILTKFKSSKEVQKVQEQGQKVQKTQDKVQKEVQKGIKQDNHAIAKLIIDKAMASVLMDITKASPKDRIAIVERLTLLYGNNENQKSALDRVIDAITGVINEQ